MVTYTSVQGSKIIVEECTVTFIPAERVLESDYDKCTIVCNDRKIYNACVSVPKKHFVLSKGEHDFQKHFTDLSFDEIRKVVIGTILDCGNISIQGIEGNHTFTFNE
jgi:hypothetical protein